MGKYFNLNEFTTEFNKLLDEKNKNIPSAEKQIGYSNTQIEEIHAHLFGHEENKELNYLIPEYFLEAAQYIVAKHISTTYTPKIINGGKIYDGNEFLATPKRMRNMEHIFVLTQNNELLIELGEKDRGKANRFNHSLLAEHKPVKMAGTINVQEGVIKTITNDSGHFTPSDDNFKKFLTEYVNKKELTLCSKDFRAKYIFNDTGIVGDVELKDISSEDIASLLANCPRVEVTLSRPAGFPGARRGFLFGRPEASPAAGGLFGRPEASPAAGGLFGRPEASPAAGGLFASLLQRENGDNTGTRKRSFKLIEGEKDNDVDSSTGNFMDLLAADTKLRITPLGSPQR